MLYAIHQDNDGGCFYCGEQMFFLDPGLFYNGLGEIEQGPDVASEDHVTPITLGGTRHRSNVVVAHRQCNSIKANSPPTPAMLERLDALNQKRGFYRPNKPGQMNPDTFFTAAETTKAMHYLCDLLNDIEGVEGTRARSKLARRLEGLIAMRRSLRQITDERHRIALFEMYELQICSVPLYKNETLNGLTNNVTRAMVKREKEVIVQRKLAEEAARRVLRDEARAERRRLRREDERLLSQTSSPPSDNEPVPLPSSA